MEYKVGQKYRLTADRAGERLNDVIIVEAVKENLIYYRNTRNNKKSFFEPKSLYSKALKLITCQKSLHVTTDGITTYAVLKEGDKVVNRAEARCSSSDTFDFETGAKIAFDRLFEKQVEEKSYTVIKQKEYKRGDKVKIVDRWSEGCHQNLDGKMDKWLGKIMTVSSKYDLGTYKMLEDTVWNWYPNAVEGKVFEPEEIKEKFKSYLLSAFTGSHLGYIGDETIQTDEFGEKLKVGDVVALSSLSPLYNEFFGDYVVCKSENYPNGFIMGAANAIFTNGRSGMRSIKKIMSYQEVEDGEIIQSIEYVKSEATANENH